MRRASLKKESSYESHDSNAQDARKLCLFDVGRDRFSPFSFYRPLSEIRCGMLTLRRRIEMMTGLSTAGIFTDPSLRDVVDLLLRGSAVGDDLFDVTSEGVRSPVPVLFLRSTQVPTRDAVRRFLTDPPGTVFRVGGILTGFVAPPAERALPVRELLDMDRDAEPEWFRRNIGTDVRDRDVDSLIIGAVWDIIEANEQILAGDYDLSRPAAGDSAPLPGGVHAHGEEAIWVDGSAEVGSGVVIDASAGPVWIEEGVRVMPFSSIQGPAFVGPGCILSAARLSGGTTIGPRCRVGGEIEASVLQGYANKAHEGFLGHSFVGEWVNLGAGTTNSDLKNNYGSVRLTFGRERVDTGMLKLGALIGDHVKTGIGTLFNTGSVIGTGCNLFGGGLAPAYAPSFVWGGGDGFEEYLLDAFLSTAETVMGRRNVVLDAVTKTLIESIYRRTEAERGEWLSERVD